jgi:hypothetical protein
MTMSGAFRPPADVLQISVLCTAAHAIVLAFFSTFDSQYVSPLPRLPHICSLSVVIITTATFCMWMLWALTWLAQWHPLIRPTKSAE